MEMSREAAGNLKDEFIHPWITFSMKGEKIKDPMSISLSFHYLLLLTNMLTFNTGEIKWPFWHFAKATMRKLLSLKP